MKKWLIGSGILVLAVVVGASLFHKFSGGAKGQGVEVDWRLLLQMDYVTGKSSSELQALNGRAVKIPGFMVPLEDNQRAVTEFLLVPSPQACIHVPAPPPNQMVYVKMKEGVEVAFGPIWVHGTLNLVTKRSMYGESSFEIIGDSVEPYR
ncbi:DUF3299 domain-containing protein [Bdellovibrio sp. HCB337]|uniref:DUF3299 domain-containing protein n=1 Tax=Bdellovibrio sp. HCB337 TaxID=3394358 RepID=UPI0039A6C56F